MSYLEATQWLGGSAIGLALALAGWRALRARHGRPDPFGGRRLFLRRRRALWS